MVVTPYGACAVNLPGTSSSRAPTRIDGIDASSKEPLEIRTMLARGGVRAPNMALFVAVASVSLQLSCPSLLAVAGNLPFRGPLLLVSMGPSLG